ncbi:MAG: type II secretion system protein [Paeniclostridium sordellii]|uniref:Type II secretion system protein n=1 Tax=Paeniclostridium hominis TaxID=2764329 RepID=A0ABR7K537_9FIRM|nr:MULTISPECIES: type II secretion system protein [Paeniclostridium]MBC6004201.1 type II secretion system protein [Paeniclostridium hominis]MDU2591113.1 type II secretion system protein [Paeniclostridium sordellii]
MNNKMKKRRGFTLIELVMVVAILGTLSSIALVKFTDVGKDSKVNSDYVTASNIATAAKLALNSNVDEGKINLNYLVDEKYLESIPKPQSVDGKEFEVHVSNGDVTVKIDQETFYPREIKNVSGQK